MSIAKRNLIESITSLISDQILREQMIALHLGKLSAEDIKSIREEREMEAMEILKIPQEYAVTECVTESKTIVHSENTPDNINGQSEK
jgi:hypothetical protein